MSTDSASPGAFRGFPRYALASLGCKVSRIDAAGIASALEAAGARRAEPGEADILLVEACTVTARADRDGRKLIRAFRHENPLATLVVSGCLAERDPEGLARMPEVDLVVPLGVEPELADLLDRRADVPPDSKLVRRPEERREGRLVTELSPGRTRAFLKVQDGCARRCAFCVARLLRGPERSADPRDVEAEIRRLGDAGVPEVVLSGIHLASYGRDRGTTLLSLLLRLERDAPRCRVRLSSLEPMEAGEELVDFVSGSSVVCPHLHLPLQSGSDGVLRRMRRGITAARFAYLARRAVDRCPRLHLATDVIAGFPGETDAEFEETLSLIRALPFASLHVFPFSPREGTEAARAHEERPVPRGVVAERARTLRRLGDDKARGFLERAAGSVAEVVVLRGGRVLTDHYLEAGLDAAVAPPPGARLHARLVLDADGELAATPVDSHGGRSIDSLALCADAEPVR